jgi:hypothetical protein
MILNLPEVGIALSKFVAGVQYTGELKHYCIGRSVSPANERMSDLAALIDVRRMGPNKPLDHIVGSRALP